MKRFFEGYTGAKAKEIAMRCANAEEKVCPKDKKGNPLCHAGSQMWGEVYKACPKRGQ
jgi:hypothetical protein